MSSTHLARLGRLAAGLALLSGAASAQTVLSGNVFDAGGGGPLVSGTIYHSTAGFTVPADQTLTVPADVVIKMSNLITVFGDLVITGTASQPSTITSFADDTFGGDTFLDGPTVGAASDWSGIRVLPGGRVEFRHTDIAYAGKSGWRAIDGNGGEIELYDCTIRDSAGSGIEINAFDTLTVVERCDISGNSGYAVDRAIITRLDSFLDNTASGNALGDVIRVANPTVDVSTTLESSNLINATLLIDGSAAINAGVDFTLGAGVGIKVETGLIQIFGNLRSNGTALNPNVFTALEDDDYFGDTENDGPTDGAPGSWGGLRSLTGGSVELHHTVLRYNGQSGWDAVFGSGGSIALFDCTILDGSGPGIELNSTNVSTVIERCHIADNAGWAIDRALIDLLESFQDNTASGNGLGDAIRVANPSVNLDVTVGSENLINDVLVVDASMAINAGNTLTLNEGVALKIRTGLVSCFGTLRSLGTELDPNVITALEDDDFFGDTENDGPTSGAPGSWSGLRALAGGAIDLEHTTVRFCGQSGWSAAYGSGGDISLRSCTLRDGSDHAVDLNNFDVPVTIVDCDIEDNAGDAITEIPINRLVGLDSNRASGNDFDFVRATASLAASATISQRMLIGGVLVVPSTVNVPVGSTLTIEPGVTLKMITGLLTIFGGFEALGTGLEPVTITSFEDDSVAGDTNADGTATTGQPGQWNGVRMLSGSVSRLEHLTVRYGGQSGWEGVDFNDGSTALSLDSVRVDRCSSDGIHLDSIDIPMTNLVAFENAGVGIKLEGGLGDLIHATSVGNGSTGIEDELHFGSVINSNSWSNAPNYNGFGAGDLIASNGDNVAAGSLGNLNVDPLFVDAAAGDLRLGPGSPVVDQADFLTALGVVTDFHDASRLVRTVSGGTPEGDMGAYEQVRWSLSKSGSMASGETLVLQLDGAPGLALYGYGLLDGTLYLSPYGFLLCGSFSVQQLGLGGVVGAAYPVPLPDNPALVGLGLGFQGFGIEFSDPNTAHLTNVFTAPIEPELP